MCITFSYFIILSLRGKFHRLAGNINTTFIFLLPQPSNYLKFTTLAETAAEHGRKNKNTLKEIYHIAPYFL